MLCAVMVKFNYNFKLLHNKNVFISNVILFCVDMVWNTALHLDFARIWLFIFAMLFVLDLKAKVPTGVSYFRVVFASLFLWTSIVTDPNLMLHLS